MTIGRPDFRARARRGRLQAVGVFTALMLTPVHAQAQAVRGWVGTSLQMVELRPFGLGTKDRTLAGTEDVSLTAWGFGVEGLSFSTLLRGRARFGGDLVWPRSDDELDAILAYGQLVRGDVRVRVGRQELQGGLGFSGFDGVLLRGRVSSLDVDAYGGRSLARGLREPINEALKGLDSFVPDVSSYLMGLAAHTRTFGTDITARYHREILSDRSSLTAERGSIDLTSVLPGARVTASLDYDFAFAQVGKSHISLSFPMSSGHWLLETTGRRYVPYFELSTIWGFFQPVAYSELEVRTAWSGRPDAGVWASLGWRTYSDAQATVVFRPLQDTGWRGGLGAQWAPAPSWVAQAQYRLDWGPGGFLSSLDASTRYARSEHLGVSVSLMSFQQIEEFRIGEGRAYGGGLSADWRLGDRTTLAGGGSVLRHAGSELDTSWNQARAWTSLRVEIGRDPGLVARRQR